MCAGLPVPPLSPVTEVSSASINTMFLHAGPAFLKHRSMCVCDVKCGKCVCVMVVLDVLPLLTSGVCQRCSLKIPPLKAGLEISAATKKARRTD